MHAYTYGGEAHQPVSTFLLRKFSQIFLVLRTGFELLVITPGEDVRQGKSPEVYGKKSPVKFAIFVNGKVL